MRSIVVRPVIAAASIVAAAGILAAGLALRPAIAGSTAVSPDASVTCTSGSPCQTYKNKGVGAGLQGINTNKSPFGSGLIGTATGNGNGVSGFSTTNNGVNGSGANVGVSGTGGTWGVYGYTNASGGIGVDGQSVNGDGVDGFSSCCTGVSGASGNGVGVEGIGESTYAGVLGIGGQGDAVEALAGWTSPQAVAIYGDNPGISNDGNGADIRGSYIGVVARNYAGQGYPFVAVDTNAQDLFFVDSVGNAYTHGSYLNFSRTRGGKVATSFGATSTTPSIEDNGTAQLVNGIATVQLDRAFANSIDTSRAYQVMLTPDGDTRGLFVASKSPTSFVVREVQGGRGTLAFDYHIYATKMGQANTRMTEMTATQAAAMFPKAPVGPRRMALRPKMHLLHPTH